MSKFCARHWIGLAILLSVIGLTSVAQNGWSAEPSPAPYGDEASKALPITDNNVVPYAARVRLTRGTWDYLRLVMRDMFKQWGSPKRDTAGINLLLDPGYDRETKTAGPLRNTPLERLWAYQPGHSCTWGDCNSTNKYSIKAGTEQWLQVRRYQLPGQLCNNNNTTSDGNARGLIDTNLQNLHSEHGFYVTKDGQCFTEINVCTPNPDNRGESSPPDIHTNHVGNNDPECTMEALDTGTVGIWAQINLAAFVYPHGGVESLPTPLEPTYNPPDVGTYTGFSTRYGLRESIGRRNASDGCNWIGACGSSVSNQPIWVASGFPSTGNYDPFYVHHKDTGSYFRPGDDQAVYLNIGQMQVQSLQRVGAANIWYQLKDRQSGRCLAVSGGLTANGTAIIHETCAAMTSAPHAAGLLRQMFQHDYATGNLKTRLLNGKCVSFASASDGAAMTLFDCVGDASHITVFDRVEEKIRNQVPTYVIDAVNSTTVGLREYTGLAQQQWQFFDTGENKNKWLQLKVDDQGTCAEVNASNRIRHQNCNPAQQAQLFYYHEDTQSYRSAKDWGRCIDAEGGVGHDRELISYPCHYGNNQRFVYNTSNRTIKPPSYTDACFNADGNAGSYVQLWGRSCFICTGACGNGESNEKWTYIYGDVAFAQLRPRSGDPLNPICLELPVDNPAAGNTYTAIIAPCNNALDRQLWFFDTLQGYVRSKANTDWCLDHQTLNTLQVTQCSGSRHRFDRQGEIIQVRNGYFVTHEADLSAKMREPLLDRQNYQQINEPYTIIYEPSMHDCGDFQGNEKVYTGLRDGSNEPEYFDAMVTQCLRPKSYWHGPPNICESGCTLKGTPKLRWTPCDPFDSYLADNSFNPLRDDNFSIYPAPYAPQSRTCGVADSKFEPANSGWYGFKIDDLVLKSDAAAQWAEKNSIELTLSTKDMHLELGFWVDANLYAGLSGLVADPKRRWALINARIKDLIASPRIKIYSIDNSSCSDADGNCDGYHKPWTNQFTDPDRLVIDVELTQDDIILNLDNPSFQIVSAPSCFVAVVGICAMSSESLVGTVMEELGPVIKDVLIPMIQDAVRGAVESLPELNTVLGNPMNMGTTLIDVGLYATPAVDAFFPDPTPPVPGKRWPVRIFDGPSGGREITDMRFALGFKPIPFILPPQPTGFVTIDANDPPLAGSVYGVPTLIDPDTSGCHNAQGNSYAHTILAKGSYTYNSSTGFMTLNYTTGSHTDMRVGYVIRNLGNDYAVAVKAVHGSNRVALPAGLSAELGASGNFEIDIGVMSGMNYSVKGSTGILVPGQAFRDDSTGKYATILEIRTGRILVDGYSLTDFNGNDFTIFNCSRPPRYPAHDEDQQADEDDYVVTGSYTDPQTGIHYTAPQVLPEYWKGPIEKHKRSPDWCATPQELRQYSTPTQMGQIYPQTSWLSFDSTWDKKVTGQPAGTKNTVGGWDTIPGNKVLRLNANDGSTEPNPVGYDFSIHLHQRTLASLLQAVVSSGAACLEFASQDTTGADTPWKSLLATERFAAFIPELQILFPNQHVSVRVYPTRAPHVRTGVGMVGTDEEPGFTPKDTNNGPLPIGAEPYTLGIAFPDLRIEFWVQDQAADIETKVLSMYWNTVLGFYARNVRACYKLDPLFGTEECTSTQVDTRTVSGYYELFLDLNSPSLQRAFENSRDGFAAGTFTTPGIGLTRGDAAVVIDQSLCDTSSRCDVIGFSQAVPTLLSSLLQVFFVTRLQFMNMSLDLLYLGADGPNDDLVPPGAPGGTDGGDYLAVYGRLLGNLNVFDLLGTLNLAPPMNNRVPYLTLGGFEGQENLVFNTNSPSIPVSLLNRSGEAGSIDSYTYSINDGFWKPPVRQASLNLGVLTEGTHKLALRAINDSSKGTVIQKVPTVLHFAVDTVPPEIHIGSRKGWGWWGYLPVTVSDLQTSSDEMSVVVSIDGGAPVPLEDGEIPLRGFSMARHVVRVSAFDNAGNEAKAVKEIRLKGGGCNSSQADGGLFIAAVTLGLLAVRRLRAKGNTQVR